jgi:hypothetical protein
MAMKSAIVFYIHRVIWYRRFDETSCLHLQDRRLSQANNQQEAATLHPPGLLFHIEDRSSTFAFPSEKSVNFYKARRRPIREDGSINICSKHLMYPTLKKTIIILLLILIITTTTKATTVLKSQFWFSFGCNVCLNNSLGKETINDIKFLYRPSK